MGRNSTFRLFCFSTLCILATIGSLGTARSQSARIVGEAGDWIAVESAGVTAYATRGSSDSRVEIRCDVARTDDFSATGIAVELNGLVAPSNSDVRFDVDGEVITFKFAPAGSPSFSDCPDCAARFDALWRRIRAGSRLMVTYSDGTTATFSLRGTARLLPTEPCPTATAAPQSVAAPPASESTSHTAAGDRYATVAPAPLPELERVALSAPQPCGVIAPDTGALIARGMDRAAASGLDRVALVVGMEAYGNGIGALRNPIADVSAVANALLGLGFTVYYVTDAPAAAIRACAERLAGEHPAPQVAMFYYAGHGIQIADDNYLLGIDADPSEGQATGFEPFGEIADIVRGDAAAFLIFLDACRNNPFDDDGPAGLSASTGRGLTRAEAAGPGDEGVRRAQARGVSVAYSTSPNGIALDGSGDLSPFAAALARHITTPGYSIQRVMSEVANSVGEATDWSQTPWTRSSLTAELKLAGPMTVGEAQAASENWASRSRELLERGKRQEAIAAALKGLPVHLDDQSARDQYPHAYDALANAYLSGNSPALAELASVDGRLHHGVWVSPDRRRYVAAHGLPDGRLDFGLYDASDGTRVAKLFDAYEHRQFPHHGRHQPRQSFGRRGGRRLDDRLGLGGRHAAREFRRRSLA